jgi:hypothetical protein
MPSKTTKAFAAVIDTDDKHWPKHKQIVGERYCAPKSRDASHLFN